MGKLKSSLCMSYQFHQYQQNEQSPLILTNVHFAILKISEMRHTFCMLPFPDIKIWFRCIFRITMSLFSVTLLRLEKYMIKCILKRVIHVLVSSITACGVNFIKFLWDTVCQWVVECRKFSVCTPVCSTSDYSGPSWSWSYDSWIYNYLCNQCLLPLTLWVRTPFMASCTRYNIML